MALFNTLKQILTPYANKINLHSEEIEEIQSDVSEVKADLVDLQEGGYIADEQQIQTKINDWLDDHPEATTTVQDGSLTEAKFADPLKLKTIKEYVTPQMYGAKADGVTDDTQAIQNAVNSGKNVLFPKGTYVCGVINITGNNIIIDGSFSTLLHGSNSGFILSKTSHDITIKNFHSICEYEKDSQQQTNVHIGIEADAENPDEKYYSYNVIVENVNFDGGVMGFSASSVKNIVIDSCKFNGFVYKPEDGAGGYGILLQSCLDVKISDCDFLMGAYGRHDIYVSVDQKKTENKQCKNISIDHCCFDHSLLELNASGYYYSPNTVAVNVRTSENVILKNSSAYSVTGLVSFVSEDGNVTGAVVANNNIDSPVYNSGGTETKQVININGIAANNIQAVIENISVLNLPNDYSIFMSVTYGNVFLTDSDIGATRIICNSRSTIFIDNIKTDIMYYFCRFNGTIMGYINNIYFASGLVGDKYYYGSSVDVSGLRIKDDENTPTQIPLTANTNYIAGFTNMSYRVGKIGYINCIFTVSAEIQTNTVFITLPENVKTRFDGVIYKNNAFKGRVICQNSDIMPNVAISADQAYHSINAVVVFN